MISDCPRSPDRWSSQAHPATGQAGVHRRPERAGHRCDEPRRAEPNQLTGGDGVILTANSPTEGFGPLSKTYLAAHFELQANTGGIQVWSPTRS